MARWLVAAGLTDQRPGAGPALVVAMATVRVARVAAQVAAGFFLSRIRRAGFSRQRPKVPVTGPIAASVPSQAATKTSLDPLHYCCFARGIRMPDSPDANAWSFDECATAEILEQVKRKLPMVGLPNIECAKLPKVYNDAVMALRLCE